MDENRVFLTVSISILILSVHQVGKGAGGLNGEGLNPDIQTGA